MVARSNELNGRHLGVIGNGDRAFIVRSIQVPEPASLALLGLGFAALAAAPRRKQS